MAKDTRKKAKAKSASTVDQVLKQLAGRFDRAHSRKEGTIHLQLLGAGGGDFVIASDRLKTTVSGGAKSKPAVSGESAHLRIIGDADRIRAILEGRKDGLAAFAGGGIRVQGDLRYLSALATELGFVKKPF